ncbi:MAG: hypothetical protein AAGE94_08410 [Acidobacteriota bacterium]
MPIVSRAAIVVDPFSPHAGEPFVVAFGGIWNYADVGSPAAVEIDGTTIRVTRDVVIPNVLPPSDLYAFTVDVGPLPAGQYTIELWIRGVNTVIEDIRPEGHREIVIVPAASIRARQPILALPDGYFFDGSNLMRFEAEIFAGCARLLPPTAHPDSRTIVVPVDRECPILPPSPALLQLDVEQILLLEAGSWTIQMIDNDSHVVAAETLEILPSEITLRDGRFELMVEWIDVDQPTPGRLVGPPSVDSALLWFFDPTNWELMVKVLDGCAINGHYWVFGAAQTDLAYRLQVRDTLTDKLWEQTNAAGTPSPAITDITAFPTCP